MRAVAATSSIVPTMTCASRTSASDLAAAAMDCRALRNVKRFFARQGLPDTIEISVRRGLLAPSLVISFAHGEEEVQRTLAVLDEAFAVYYRALEQGV